MSKQFVRYFVGLLLAVVAGVVLCSCATPDLDDSELPWNTPQSWEGSPMMPGMNDQ